MPGSKAKSEIIISAKDETQRKMIALGRRLDATGKKLKGIGKTASLYMTIPVVAGFTGMTKAASDLNETLSKTSAIFGKDNSISKWAKKSGKDFGLSQRAALDYASRYGGALKEIGGLSNKQAEKTAIALTKLTSDLASFFNTSQDVASDALGAALTGEYEQLKKFNVVINESILKQKAFALGLGDGKRMLTAQEKQMATLSLLYEKTGDAQGDFVRTSDGLANKQRILKAKFEDTAASLGKILLPVAIKLVDIAQKVLDKFSNLSDGTQKTIIYIAGLAAAMGPLLVITGHVVTATNVLIVRQGILRTAFLGTAKAIKVAWAAVLKPLAAIAAVLGVVGVAITGVAGELDNVKASWSASLTAGQKAMLAMKQGLHFIRIGAQTVVTGFLRLVAIIADIPRYVEDAYNHVRVWFAKMGEKAMTFGNEALAGIEGLMNGLIQGVVDSSTKAFNALMKVSQDGINKMIDGLNVLNPFDKIGHVDFGTVSIDAPKVSLGKIKAEFDTTFKAAGKNAAAQYLDGLVDASAAGTAELMQSIPDASSILTKTAEATEEVAEAFDAANPNVEELMKNMPKLTEQMNNAANGAGKAAGASGGLGKALEKTAEIGGKAGAFLSGVFNRMGKDAVAALALAISAGTATAEQKAEYQAIRTLTSYEQALEARSAQTSEVVKRVFGKGLEGLNGGEPGGIPDMLGNGYQGGYGGELGSSFDNGGFGSNIFTPGQAELDQLRAYYDQRMAVLQEKGMQETELAKSIEAERNQAVLSLRKQQIQGYGQAFNSILQMTEQFAGKQSGIYRAMFAASKAFAVAESIIAIQQSIAKAAAVGWPANIPLIAQAVAQGAQIISAIQGTQASFEGGGFTGSGARTGGVDGKGGFNAVLHPNETVVDHAKGQGPGGVTVNITIHGDPNPTVVEEIKAAAVTKALETQVEVNRRGGGRAGALR